MVDWSIFRQEILVAVHGMETKPPHHQEEEEEAGLLTKAAAMRECTCVAIKSYHSKGVIESSFFFNFKKGLFEA
jgi:hypothetical protein